MKKATPIITHVEVICFAIRHLEAEIEAMVKKCEGNPGATPMLEWTTERYGPKLEALKEMYLWETGNEYV